MFLCLSEWTPVLHTDTRSWSIISQPQHLLHLRHFSTCRLSWEFASLRGHVTVFPSCVHEEKNHNTLKGLAQQKRHRTFSFFQSHFCLWASDWWLINRRDRELHFYDVIYSVIQKKKPNVFRRAYQSSILPAFIYLREIQLQTRLWHGKSCR